ncbi:MAG: hypothetical protein VX519_02045 [Myxococcota bacterium]|nr:hypothetical protein [Myxococcota bacterium]
MARVFLIGAGPLPGSNPDSLGFAQLRTRWFLQALSAKHEVCVVLLQGCEQPVGEHATVDPAEGDWIARLSGQLEAFAPDVVVSAAPYDTARAAAMCAGERPLWVDVPGDPFAEAQAKASHTGDSVAYREMRAAYGPALARADAFSGISEAQRHALVGQLGILGRLEGAPIELDWVFSLPAVYDFGDLLEADVRTREPKTPLTVALSGGYNTWLDGEGLLEGLHRAMGRADVRVVSTGGAIEGHHGDTYRSFQEQACSGPHADRFTFHGWVPHHEVPLCLETAHVGISLDRPGFEPELGTRTRLLFFVHQGMEVITTLGCDLCREMEHLVHGVPSGDPEALARVLVELYEQGQDGRATQAAREHLLDRYTLDSVMAPLLQWVENPARVAAVDDPTASLGEELARVRAELAAVHATPTWKASGILKRSAQQLGRIRGGD